MYYLDKLKVLIADNDVRFRKLLSEAVDKTNFGRVIHVASKGSIAIEWMEQCGVDVVILDTQILKSEGMNIIGEIRKKYPKIEIIISDSAKYHSPECTLEALKLGAIDFFLNRSAGRGWKG